MARHKVKLDHDGIAKLLKSSEAQRLVREAAGKIADEARSQGQQVGALHGPGDMELPVKVETSTTDRARASVILAHPAGIAVQAKHGTLTRAAAAAGLKVRTKGD